MYVASTSCSRYAFVSSIVIYIEFSAKVSISEIRQQFVDNIRSSFRLFIFVES